MLCLSYRMYTTLYCMNVLAGKVRSVGNLLKPTRSIFVCLLMLTHLSSHCHIIIWRVWLERISIYIYIHPAMQPLVPKGPHATHKHKAGSITSDYLANVMGPKLASPCRVSWVSLRLTSKPWLVYCDSRFGLPLSLTSSGFTGQLSFAALLDTARVSWGPAMLCFNTGGVTGQTRATLDTTTTL